MPLAPLARGYHGGLRFDHRARAAFFALALRSSVVSVRMRVGRRWPFSSTQMGTVTLALAHFRHVRLLWGHHPAS